MSLEWCAGFFDGEGHVSCTSPYVQSGRKREYRQLLCSVAQVDRRPLEKFVAGLSLGTISGPYTKVAKNQQPIHRCFISGYDNILSAYRQMKPYLVLKQEQFERAFDEFDEYQAALVRDGASAGRVFRGRLARTGFRDHEHRLRLGAGTEEQIGIINLEIGEG